MRKIIARVTHARLYAPKIKDLRQGRMSHTYLPSNKIHTNGGYGLIFFTQIVAASVAIAIVSMPARCEMATLVHVSGKSTDAGQANVEVRVQPQTARSGVSQCEQLLMGVSDESGQVIRVRKILKDNLHWRGDRHLFLAKTANMSDIDAAYSALSDDDIPVLVSLIGRGRLKRGMPSITFGVLGRFGAKALPCIEAGMAAYPEKGASDLSSIKGNIEVEIRYPNPNRSVTNPISNLPHIKKEGKKP